MDSAQIRAKIDEMVSQMSRLTANAADLKSQVQQTTGKARSPDGLVSIIVGPGGQLIDLTLDPRIYRQPDSTRLAQIIADTFRKASTDMAEKVERLLSDFVPPEVVRAHMDYDLDGIFNRVDSELDDARRGKDG